MRVLLEIWPIPVLILGVVGGIYSGIASATEAAALGALFAAIIGLVRRELTWKAFKTSVLEALESTAAIFFVAFGALLLTRLLAFAGLPTIMAESIGRSEEQESDLQSLMRIPYAGFRLKKTNTDV